MSRLHSHDQFSSSTEYTQSPRQVKPKERRSQNSGVPANARQYLNDDQLYALQQMESFGWQLAFIRRPLFRARVVVVMNTDKSKYGVLEEDGTMNMEPDIDIRR